MRRCPGSTRRRAAWCPRAAGPGPSRRPPVDRVQPGVRVGQELLGSGVGERDAVSRLARHHQAGVGRRRLAAPPFHPRAARAGRAARRPRPVRRRA
ncbi:hypothetical protein APASM_6979 [Actinosynnema pretiosum subsp. pretiosum]|nr:hypothetical protein APASM_6979 [Actinosynnema pretiosum subsp. pretiosum]